MPEACFLCPRKCGAKRPESMAENAAMSGFCKSPRNPVVARAGLHFWEEPVVSGKRGSGAVFFSGCNLKCVFCQNYSISTCGAGKEISVGRLREIYGELIEKGAHNINLVTPGHFTEAILESLEGPALPVPVVYNTNGYDSVETVRRFEGRVQIYLPDFKYADNALAEKYSAAPDYFETFVSAVREMYRQTGPYELDADGMMERGVIIRHLILPGCLENSKRIIDWIADNFNPGEVMFSLMRQYLPCGRVSENEFRELNRTVSGREYAILQKYLYDSGIEDGFLQEKTAARKEFIPAFDGSGV